MRKLNLRHTYPFSVGWNLTPFYSEVVPALTNTLFSRIQ
ncbi:hypothetical protein A4157S3_1030178 [Escherichia coli]|nr:hypothetical protein A4157S3_1030178 [Escherichia coli]SOQ84504.1 hypothetical protein DSM301R_730179 [Escherichia coli]